MHVVSTAGHVDHGKSTLIERLTGIDPDRLAEEKQRGLTIDLGFAWMKTPAGRELGIVDVPGHERFIHNMLAGVGSVDASMFIVAANEGWMPQSEEHLQILDLLGARAAVVAITKADLVDDEALGATFAQIRARLERTGLRGSEIVAVSATTGAGIPDLLIALDRMLTALGPPPDLDRPRVRLDRAFSVQGVGTVVTGTLSGGSLAVGDAVTVLPAGHATRIRGIQSHRTVRDRVEPVSRVALNLAGLERTELARGDVVVLAGQWRATTELDVTLRAVASNEHALVGRGAYKAYVGSAEVDARLSVYDGDLAAGTEGFARLTLTAPVVAAPFDRFVLRDPGRRRTVGGGVILDPHPPSMRGAARAARPAQLTARAAATPDDIPTLFVAERGVVERTDLPTLACSSAAPRDAVSLRTLEVARGVYDETAAAIVDALTAFHSRQPLVRGASREDVRAATGIRDPRTFNEVVEHLGDRVAVDGPLLRLAEHRVVLSLEQEGARDVLLRQLDDAAFMPPSMSSLTDSHGEPLVRALLDDGTLVRVGDDLVLTVARLNEAKRLIADAIRRDGALTASEIKELLGTSRKYAIPLLEHLDATGFTRRSGDVRSLA